MDMAWVKAEKKKQKLGPDGLDPTALDKIC